MTTPTTTDHGPGRSLSAAFPSKRHHTPTQQAPTIRIATYNIQDGRNNRLETVCRALQQQNIDLAILTELRIPASRPIHTRHCLGYNILVTYSTTPNQGGLALVTKADTKT